MSEPRDTVAPVDWKAYEAEALAAYESASTLDELNDVNVRFLGRRADLPQALRQVRDRETGKTLNELRERPRFYNTLTTNCTTAALFHTRVNPETPPLSWKILLSGYLPDYAYELGRIDTTRPFPELERMSKVNERAHAADKDPAFSQRIREGLPVPPPLP